jgi:hypothetical protein
VAAQAANNFSGLATSLSANAAPALKASQDYYSAILKGGPEAYAAVSPAVDFTKQQFQNAGRQLRQTGPAGGAQVAGATQLASTEAQTISNLYQNNISSALAGLTGLGESETGAALNASQGQTGVASQLGTLAAQQLSAWTSGISGLAGGIGALYGFKSAPSH